MNPSNIAGAGIGFSAAGGIVGAFGSILSGGSQQKMYAYQAALARQNAQVAQQDAEYATQKGEQQAQSYGMQASQRQGQIKTAQAASGLDVNSGSAAQVQSSQRLISSMDLATIRSNAAKTAYDYSVQATGFQNQATVDLAAGRNAESAGYINATSTLIGSASSVSSKWLQGQQVGLFGGSSGGIGMN